MLGFRTLVLNASYEPINILPLKTIPAEDAVTRVYNGTCHVVEEHDQKILTPTADMRWPSVIARNAFEHYIPNIRLYRESLFYRDHGICMYCEKPLKISEVTFDHYIPESAGGEKTWENIVCACARCNSAKGSSEPVGIWAPKYKPYRPTYFQLLEKRKKFPIFVQDKSWIDYLPDWESEVIINRNLAAVA